MKKILTLLLMGTVAFSVRDGKMTAWNNVQNDAVKPQENLITLSDEETNDRLTNGKEEVSEVKVKVTVGDTELYATLEDNATTRALVEQMPVTLPMMDLYGREMCYRYGAYALPTDHLQSDGYEIGDIAYWAPGGSLVILYEQNGEHFERQHLGHIDSGVEVFKNTGDTDVTFELMPSEVPAGDVDGNGKVDLADAQLVLKKALRIIDTFPVEK